MKPFLTALSALILSISVPAISFAQTSFQDDSETGMEETVETRDGKTTRKVRTGKIRNRKGEARVGAIEEGEVDQVSRRQKALNHSAFGFGPFGSSNVGENTLLYGFSYGRHWEVTTTAEITLDVLGAFNSKGSLWNGGLGMAFLPMTSSVSPLIGASLGFGYADMNPGKTDVGGFSGQLKAGVRLFRLSEVQMEIVGTYTAIFAAETPGVYGAQLKVLF